MMEHGASPSAGWFPDPWHRAEHRWFDGARWTPHVSTRGAPGFDPPAGATNAGAARQGSRKWLRATVIMAGLVAAAGLVLWIAASLANSAACAFRGERDRGAQTATHVGMLMMIVAPLVGWVMVPAAATWLRSKPVLAVAIVIPVGGVCVLAVAAVQTITPCA